MIYHAENFQLCDGDELPPSRWNAATDGRAAAHNWLGGGGEKARTRRRGRAEGAHMRSSSFSTDGRTTECGNGKIKADGKYKRRGSERVREGRAQSYNPLRGHTNKEHVLGQLCRKNQRRVKVEAAKMALSLDMVAGRAVYSMEGEREGALVCLGNSRL